MGTWGPGIFDDDVALDVRRDFLDLLREDAKTASRKLRKSWGTPDVDEAAPFWLALAATQWAYGVLDPVVAKRAMTVRDRDEWDGDKARARAVAALRAKLARKNPKPKSPPREPARPKIAWGADLWQGDTRAYVWALSGQTQVGIDVPGMGGGVFAATECPVDRVALRWVKKRQLEVTYPRAATVVDADDTAQFGRRIIKLIYKKR